MGGDNSKFPPISLGEIRGAIADMRWHSAPGSGKLTTEVFYRLSAIQALLVPLFNGILATGLLPEGMSLIAVPLEKSGKDRHLSSLRPITLLNCILKNPRKKSSICDFSQFAVGWLVADSQYGFMQGLSSEMALADLVSHIAISEM